MLFSLINKGKKKYKFLNFFRKQNNDNRKNKRNHQDSTYEYFCSWPMNCAIVLTAITWKGWLATIETVTAEAFLSKVMANSDTVSSASSSSSFSSSSWSENPLSSPTLGLDLKMERIGDYIHVLMEILHTEFQCWKPQTYLAVFPSTCTRNISVALWWAKPLMMVEHILGPRPRYKPKKPSRFLMYPTRIPQNIYMMCYGQNFIINLKDYCIEKCLASPWLGVQRRFEWAWEQLAHDLTESKSWQSQLGGQPIRRHNGKWCHSRIPDLNSLQPIMQVVN